MKKILHVTECFSGGVTSSLNSYVKYSNQFSHYLFASVREKDTTGEESRENLYTDVKIVDRSLLSLFKLYKYIKKIKPDLIHVHSSYAGVFVRVMPFIEKDKIIYTPHGLSFLRDDSSILKAIYILIERTLYYRTGCFAACSVDESIVAKKYLGYSKTHIINNVCEPIEIVKRKRPSSGKIVVGMMGRIVSQKGYPFFSTVAEALKDKCDFVWIGGGEESLVAGLEASGVKVTGWISRSEAIENMNNLDLYFHSAAWDGFPISVLEAAELSIPILLRDIGAFRSEDLHVLSNAASVIDEIERLVAGDSDAWERANDNKNMITQNHTTDGLSKALYDLYSE